MRKDKFFDKKIEEMLHQEEEISKEVFAQNRIDNMTPTQLMIYHTTQRLRATREQNDGAPIVRVFRSLTSFQKVVFVIMQTSACIFTLCFFILFADRRIEPLFIWSFFTMMASILTFTISQHLKNERRNNRNYFRN